MKNLFLILTVICLSVFNTKAQTAIGAGMVTDSAGNKKIEKYNNTIPATANYDEPAKVETEKADTFRVEQNPGKIIHHRPVSTTDRINMEKQSLKNKKTVTPDARQPEQRK